jgi:hypothetical protein
MADGPGRMHLVPIVDPGLFVRVWEVVHRFHTGFSTLVNPDMHVRFKKAALACVRFRDPKYLMMLFELYPTPYYQAHRQDLEAELRAAMFMK